MCKKLICLSIVLEQAKLYV